MTHHIKGQGRHQVTLLPDVLDDFVTEDNPARVIDVFVDELQLDDLGFKHVNAKQTGRPGYHPATMLKLYIYGYLNRIKSSRRLEKEAHRNVELMWLLERLTPDFKTIADFRKNNGKGIKNACRAFIDLCRQIQMFTDVVVAIDGSKFKAVITVLADKGYYSRGDIKATQDLGTVALVPKGDTSGADRKGLFNRSLFKYDQEKDIYICPMGSELQNLFTVIEDGLEQQMYFNNIACRDCSQRSRCATSKRDPRRIRRWVYEAEMEDMQARLNASPQTAVVRKQTVEHPFGTIKMWMGATHFLTQRFKNVSTEISLHVLAYNLKRIMSIWGTEGLAIKPREQCD